MSIVIKTLALLIILMVLRTAPVFASVPSTVQWSSQSAQGFVAGVDQATGAVYVTSTTGHVYDGNEYIFDVDFSTVLAHIVRSTAIPVGYIWDTGVILQKNKYCFFKDDYGATSQSPVYVGLSIPSQPTNLNITGSGGSGTLTWSTVSGTQTYNIYDGGNLLSSGISVTSYNFTGLIVGSHSLSVSAVNVAGESPKSSPVTYNVLPNSPSPTANNLTTSSATLSWPTVTGATSYDISVNGTFVSNITATTYNLSSLLYKTSYTVSVIAKSSAGNSAPGSVTFVTSDLPSPPQGLQVTNITSSTLDLSWTAVSGSTSYILDQNDTLLATTTNTYYHCSGLAPNTTYTYKVSVTTAIGESNFSNPVTATTLGIPPSAPTGLSAGNITGNSFTAYWTKQSDATAYDVYLNGTYQGTVNQPLILNPSYNFSGLNMGTTYNVTIIAGNAWGQSTASNTLSVQTLTIPSTPTGLGVNNTTNTTINISWSANPISDSITGYKIFVNGSQYGSTITGTTQAMTGFTNATTYSISIKAVNAQGDSLMSSSVTATTTDNPTTVPDPVGGITASNIQTNGLTLSWASIPKCDSYDVLNTNTNTIQTVSNSPLVIAGLQPSTTYNFEIRAHNIIDYGAYSSPFSVTTLGLPPATPTGLSAGNITGNSFTAYWTKQSDATAYDVYLNGTYQGTVNQPLILNPSYVFSGLNMGTTYNVTIIAGNTWGQSTASNPFSVQTLTIPNTPTGLTLNSTANTTINISWTANPTADSVTGYKIFVNGSQYGSTITGTTQTMTGFTNATNYTISIKAVNAQGDSLMSSSITATTTDVITVVPDPVGGITSSKIKPDGLTLTWSSIPQADSYDVLNTTTNSVQTVTNSPLTITGLQASTSYTFKIRAHNIVGYGSYSDPITVQTLSKPIGFNVDSNDVIGGMAPVTGAIGGLMALPIAVPLTFWVGKGLMALFMARKGGSI